MSNIFSKIKRETSCIYKTFRNDKHFSSSLAFIRLGEYAAGRLHLSSANAKLRTKRFDVIRRYLSCQISPVIEKYKAESAETIGHRSDKDAPIFVMWWQGEENAPEIVKKCLESIRLHAGTHPVIIVDQYNVNKYLDIPEYISQKALNGQMCLAHFSDYIRISLLNNYGGLWLDSTLFVAYDIPEEYFTMPIYTCNSVRSGMKAFVSAGRWATFCLGSWKDTLFTRVIKESFECYWKDNNSAIDYLMFDYLIDIAYSELQPIRESIDAIPLNNQRRNDLAAAMVRGKTAELFQTIVQPDTVLYKLSWRESYPLLTENGDKSIYQFFLKYTFEKDQTTI
ncbi:MAG: hypothetical protein KBT31_03755 [Firmicutes bacterium]|nr:hypothetical protein [Candidatus Colimorpha enterica]